MSARPASILPLEVLLFFDFYYTPVYIVLAIIIYIYKGATFYYPPNTLAPEIVGILLMIIMQYTRIHIGINYYRKHGKSN